MSNTKLFELSIADAGRKLRDGSITSTALTEDALSRIAAIDPALDSFITVTADRAAPMLWPRTSPSSKGSTTGRCRACLTR